MSDTIVSREAWEARPPKRIYRIDLPTPKLYLHHSASSGTDEVAVRRIQDFHMDPKPEGRNWSDIAYSFLIDNDAPDVDIFEGRGAGIAGGHTAGQNTISHAICVIGNYSTRLPHPDTLEAVAQLTAHGHTQGWWPDRITGGHRDAPGADTSCPGAALHAHIPNINARVREILEASVPLKNYEKEAIDRLEREGIFTKFTTDEPGEVDEPIRIRTFAVILDRLLDVVGSTSNANVSRADVVRYIVDALED